MAENSWPSPTYNDRAVTEAEYERLAYRFNDDGLHNSPFAIAPVIPGSGLQVLVEPGLNATVRGFFWESGDTEFGIDIDPNPGPAADRYDWVVLRLDRSTWNVRVAIRKGTPGGGKPALVRNQFDTGVYEIPLAHVRVVQNTVNLTYDDVTIAPLYVGSRVRFYGTDANPPVPGELRWTQWGYDSWDADKWVTVLYDSGWVTLAPANASNWSNHGLRCRQLNGVVHFEINMRREGSSLATDASDAAQGSLLVTLPTGFRPSQVLAFPTTLTAGISARLRMYPNGQMYLQAPSSTVGVGRFLRHTGSFAIG